MRLKFGHYFAADVWLRLRSWILVKILKLDLAENLSLSLVEKLSLVEIWNSMLNRDSETEI